MDWRPHYLYRPFFGGNDQAVEAFLAEIDFHAWNHRLDEGEPFAGLIAEWAKRYPARGELIRAFDERWEETLGGAIQPSVDILRELREAGHPLYGLTNWSAEKFNPVRRRHDFFDWFAEIVVSGEVGLAKPDPRIFRLLLDRIGRAAGECLFIDDGPRNVEAAQELGFETIRFQSPGQLRSELRRRGVLPSAG